MLYKHLYFVKFVNLCTNVVFLPVHNDNGKVGRWFGACTLIVTNLFIFLAFSASLLSYFDVYFSHVYIFAIV